MVAGQNRRKIASGQAAIRLGASCKRWQPARLAGEQWSSNLFLSGHFLHLRQGWSPDLPALPVLAFFTITPPDQRIGHILPGRAHLQCAGSPPMKVWPLDARTHCHRALTVFPTMYPFSDNCVLTGRKTGVSAYAFSNFGLYNGLIAPFAAACPNTGFSAWFCSQFM
jgi:hypothetical protein